MTWDEALDHIGAAWRAGFDQGYSEGRNDRLGDEHRAAVHDLACRTVGIRVDDVDVPRWAVAS